MSDKHAPGMARLNAVVELSNRGYGRPPQQPIEIKDILAFERVEIVATKQHFSDAVVKVPLSILYCSATDFYCDVASTENEMCDLGGHPETP
jgi:hypothetical protein